MFIILSIVCHVGDCAVGYFMTLIDSDWQLGVEGGHSLAQVQVRENESIDSALKRFKKELEQTGVLREVREHQHYEKPSDKKRKAEAARKRKIARANRSSD